MPEGSDIIGSDIYGSGMPPAPSVFATGIFLIGQGGELFTVMISETSNSIYDITGMEIIGNIGRRIL